MTEETTPSKAPDANKFTPRIATPLRRSSLPNKDFPSTPSITRKAPEIVRTPALTHINEESDEGDEGKHPIAIETPTRSTRSSTLLQRSIIDSKKSLGTPAFEAEVRRQCVLKEIVEYDHNESDSDDSFSSGTDNESKGNVFGLNNSEAFIKSQKSTQIKTSDNTLIESKVLDSTELMTIIKNLDKKHVQETEFIDNRYVLYFDEWKFELDQKFNLLLFGFGSKLNIVKKFCDSHCTDRPLITFNGFHPSATIQTLLISIIDNVMNPKKSIPIQERLQYIRNYYSIDHPKEKLCILINNIDGVTIRMKKIQNILSALASIRNISIIATTDHINASLMWNLTNKSEFNWIYHDVTTFASYYTELTFESTHLFNKKNAKQVLDIRGALYILKSLPLNTKKILKELSNWQLTKLASLNRAHPQSTKKNQDPVIGITHKDLYGKCISKFITQNDTLFRTQMVELKDHKLVVSVGNGRGDALLFIPLDCDALISVIEGSGI